MKSINSLILVALLSGNATVLASAIYDNVDPIDFSKVYTVGAFAIGSSTDFSVVPADDFMIEEGGIIRDVHWYGGYAATGELGGAPPPLESEDFLIRIYSSANGLPDDLLYTDSGEGPIARVDTGLVSPGRKDIGILQYASAVDPFTVEPGVEYWLSIVSTTTIFNLAYQADYSAGSYDHVFANENPPVTWQPSSSEDPTALLFSLTNDGRISIPEPSIVTLFIVGFAIIVVKQRNIGHVRSYEKRSA